MDDLRRSAAGALLLALVSILAGCGEGAPERSGNADGAAATVAAPFADAVASPDVLAQWARSCGLCHAGGEGGAPVVGDEAAWAPRLAQGEALLLRHTIEGFNNMPPLGYCMDCERDDFRALIRFMTDGQAMDEEGS